MEFFIPSMMVFLLAIGVSFAFIPRFTPLIAAILAIALLSFGVYEHYKMFAAEYRLSTWQQELKIYAPAVMIAAIIIFIIYAILAFFTKGAVPVPPVPNIVPEAVSPNELTKSLNNIANTLTNTTTNIVSNINKSMTKLNNMVNNTVTNENKNKNKTAENNTAATTENKNKNNLSRSILETI